MRPSRAEQRLAGEEPALQGADEGAVHRHAGEVPGEDVGLIG